MQGCWPINEGNLFTQPSLSPADVAWQEGVTTHDFTAPLRVYCILDPGCVGTTLILRRESCVDS